jgi:hypothetical protein
MPVVCSIHHPQENLKKSSAVHAKVLCPKQVGITLVTSCQLSTPPHANRVLCEQVSFYDFPDEIPSDYDPEHTILLFPSEVDSMDLFLSVASHET